MMFSAENKIENGFTLIELLVVIGIFAILSAVSIPIYSRWQETAQADNDVEMIINSLRTAKIKSQAGLNDLPHGVYIVTGESEEKIVSYQGSTYSERDTDYDSEYILDDNASLTYGLSSQDINFSLGLGIPSATGTIFINYDNDQRIQEISINDLGFVGSITIN